MGASITIYRRKRSFGVAGSRESSKAALVGHSPAQGFFFLPPSRPPNWFTTSEVDPALPPAKPLATPSRLPAPPPAQLSSDFSRLAVAPPTSGTNFGSDAVP